MYIVVYEGVLVMLLLLLIIISVGIYFLYQQMESELEKRQNRMIQLAKMLQFAETRTGHPFYTSVLLDAYNFEEPEQVYMKLRQKLNSMPVMERQVPAHYD